MRIFREVRGAARFVIEQDGAHDRAEITPHPAAVVFENGGHARDVGGRGVRRDKELNERAAEVRRARGVIHEHPDGVHHILPRIRIAWRARGNHKTAQQRLRTKVMLGREHAHRLRVGRFEISTFAEGTDIQPQPGEDACHLCDFGQNPKRKIGLR